MAGWKFFLNNIEVAEPIGWDAIEFTAKRLENHGIDQPFTTEISFIGKAANILKGFFDSGFINDDIPFRIESSVKVDGQDYEFNGFVNMAVYSEKNTCDTNGWEITVGIIEDPFRENFLTRQDVEIDLLTLKNLDQETIDPLTFRNVRLHSQQLFLQAEAKQFDERVLSFGTPFEPVFPVFWQNTDFKNQFGNTFDPRNTYVSNTNVIFVNNGVGTRNLLFSGRAVASIKNKHPTNSYKAYVTLLQYDGSGGGTGIFTTVFTTPFIAAGATYNLDHVFTQVPISIQEDYRLVYFIALDFNPVGGWDVTFPNTNTLRLEEFSTSFASNCQGLYVFDALERTLQIITGFDNPLVSDYFEVNTGLMWNNLITTGLYIRNGQLIDQANPQITLTFKKFFNDLSRIFNLGWGFEYNTTISQWQIRVEPMEFFYQNDLKIGEFNKASGIVQYALSEKLVNSFQLGFTDLWKNIAVSGIFEPHTYRSYFTPNKSRSSEKKTEDLRSNIICSGYAIEFSRRLQFLRDDSGSSDRPNDYSLFLIWLNLPEVYFPYIAGSGYEFPDETGSATFAPGTISVGSDLVGTTDSPIDSIYNILHTPARIAARYWKLLGMHTFGLETSKAALFFQSGEYYTDLVSEIDDEYFPVADQEISGSVSEKTNISEAILEPLLNQYLFKPIGFDFDFPQSLCSFITMGNLAYGYIKVTSGGQTFYGYLLDGVNKPTDPNSGKTTFKLILSKTIPLGPGAFSSGFSEGFS